MGVFSMLGAFNRGFTSLFPVWENKDTLSILVSVVLFVLGIILGRRQGKIIDHINEVSNELGCLQRAVTLLQVKEKIGVIKGRICDEALRNPSTAIYITNDTAAVLPLYEYMPRALRRQFEGTLTMALRAIAEHFPGQEELLREVYNTAQDLENRKHKRRAMILRECIHSTGIIRCKQDTLDIRHNSPNKTASV